MSVDARYWAGFFDGEGCVTFANYRERGYRTSGLRVTFSQCYWPILKIGHARFGGWLGRGKRGDGIRREQHQWHLSGKKARQFLLTIRRHLHEKRAQVDIALRLADTPFDERGTLLAELKAEKKREWRVAS